MKGKLFPHRVDFVSLGHLPIPSEKFRAILNPKMGLWTRSKQFRQPQQKTCAESPKIIRSKFEKKQKFKKFSKKMFFTEIFLWTPTKQL